MLYDVGMWANDMSSWTRGVLAGKCFTLSSLSKKFLCLGVMFREGGVRKQEWWFEDNFEESW